MDDLRENTPPPVKGIPDFGEPRDELAEAIEYLQGIQEEGAEYTSSGYPDVTTTTPGGLWVVMSDTSGKTPDVEIVPADEFVAHYRRAKMYQDFEGCDDAEAWYETETIYVGDVGP